MWKKRAEVGIHVVHSKYTLSVAYDYGPQYFLCPNTKSDIYKIRPRLFCYESQIGPLLQHSISDPYYLSHLRHHFHMSVTVGTY